MCIGFICRPAPLSVRTYSLSISSSSQSLVHQCTGYSIPVWGLQPCIHPAYVFDPVLSFHPPLLALQLFLKPIQARSLLPPDAVSVVFGNIEHILALNRELLAYVQQKGPVDAFINMGPFLKVYATYADNYNNALEVVQVCHVCVWCGCMVYDAVSEA